MSKESEILKKELENSRRNIRQLGHELGEDLNFAQKAKKSFQKNPELWVGGTSIAGLIFAKLFFRQSHPANTTPPQEGKNTKGEKSCLVGKVAKWGFGIIAPLAKTYITQQIEKKFPFSH